MHERSGVQHEGKLPTEVFLLGALRLEAGDEPDKSCMDMLDGVCFLGGSNAGILPQSAQAMDNSGICENK